MNQNNYLGSVLKRFSMFDCKTVSTASDYNFDYNYLMREKLENTEIKNKCQKLIGCIMNAMLGSRPYLCASISIRSGYQCCASNN